MENPGESTPNNLMVRSGIIKSDRYDTFHSHTKNQNCSKPVNKQQKNAQKIRKSFIVQTPELFIVQKCQNQAEQTIDAEQYFQELATKISKSKYFQISLLLVLVIFLLACILQDPKITLDGAHVCEIIELVCHGLFVFFFLCRVFSKQKQKKIWLFIDAITIISGILGFVLEDHIGRYFKAVRSIKLVFFIKQIKIFNQPATVLLNALAKFGNILIPALVIIYVYAVVGLYTFADFQFNKCRSPDNIYKAQNWTVYSHQIFLCGQKKCPMYHNQQLQCLNPIDYNVEPNLNELVNIIQGNSLLKYSNIFYAILSTFKQTFVTGSSRLIILYKQVLNPIFIEIYFYSYIYLISYIYLNIFYALIITEEWKRQSPQKRLSLENQQNAKDNQNKQQQIDKILENEGKQVNQICVSGCTKQQDDRSNGQYCLLNKDTSIQQPRVMNKQQNIKQQKTIINGELVLKKARMFNVFENCDQSPPIQSTLNMFYGQEPKIDQNATLASQYSEQYRKFQILNNIIIILCCVNLSLDFHGQNLRFKFIVDCIDFAFYFLLIVQLVVRVLIERYCLKRIEFYTKLQILIAIFCTIGVIYEAAIAKNFYDFFSVTSQFAAVLRSLKYLRIMILIFKSTIFQQARLILQSTFRSLFTIRHFAVVWLIIVVTFGIIGFHLHSNKTKVNSKTGQLDMENGVTFQVSFDSIFDSVIFTLLTFYNQQWDYIMFQQYLGGGALLIIWQLFSIIVGLLLFSKYFMAQLMKQLDLLIDKSFEINKVQQIKIENNNKQQNDQKSKANIKIVALDKRNNEMLKNVSFDQSSKVESVPKQKTARQKKGKLDRAKINQRNLTHNQKIQMVINRVLQIMKKMISSKLYKVCYCIFIISSCIVLMFTHPRADTNSHQVKSYLTLDIINKSFFLIDLFLNLVVYGLFQQQSSYLRKSWINWLNLIIVVIQVISFTSMNNVVLFNKIQKIKVLRVLRFLQFRYEQDWGMRITYHSFVQLLPKVATLFIITLLMYSYFALVLVKLYKDDSYNCLNYNSSSSIVTKNDCLLWGGDWVQQSVNVGNLFNSTFYLFCVATMEGWITLLYPAMNLAGQNMNPVRDANKYISIFFVLFFFFGNLIMLNVFIGLSVSNFKRLKDKNTGESELSSRQKEWLRVKNSIHRLRPIIFPKRPDNKIRGYAYDFANHFSYKIIQGLFFCAFLITMSLFKTNMSAQERKILLYCEYFFVFVLVCQYLIELLAFGFRVQFKTSFIFKNIIVVYAIVYIIVTQTVQMQKFNSRIMGGIFIALQFIRYLSLLDQIPFAKKLLNTIVSILPQTSNILLMICITLFIYAIIGMELFAFLKPNIELDSFNQNYTDFSTALFALIKFSTLQSPMQQISDAGQSSSPHFICRQISSYQQYLTYGQVGCGSKFWSYLFFLSFHVFYSMVLMSTVMAVIVDSYIEVKNDQQAQITKQVLEKVKQSWSELDPQATGYIPYRQFFMFAAKLMEIYMKKSKVKNNISTIFKTKEEFLKQMDIPIYQNEDKVLCFQFNQVIDALTRIYMQVSDERAKVQKMFKQRQSIIDGFKKSTYTSSHVATLIILKSGLRWWKKIATNEKQRMQYKNVIQKFNREKVEKAKDDVQLYSQMSV